MIRTFRLLGPLALLLTVQACNRASAPTAPDAMTVVPVAPAPVGTGATGMFVGAGGHAAQGTVQLTVRGGVAQLDFGANFSVTGVPGPFVYVNTTNNANTGSPLRVAALKSNAGAQSYSFQLPAGVSYKFVLIWCDPFNVPVGEATIPPTP